MSQEAFANNGVVLSPIGENAAEATFWHYDTTQQRYVEDKPNPNGGHTVNVKRDLSNPSPAYTIYIDVRMTPVVLRRWRVKINRLSPTGRDSPFADGPTKAIENENLAFDKNVKSRTICGIGPHLVRIGGHFDNRPPLRTPFVVNSGRFEMVVEWQDPITSATRVWDPEMEVNAIDNNSPLPD